jgi:1,4-dihydroxy-6-naphthoate synthase
MPKLSLAISPCPNDTFIFDALVHHKIDTEGLEFELHFADVEALNEAAFRQTYDITKLSYFAYAFVTADYSISNSGSAIGKNCGPMLIGKEILSDEHIRTAKIAIPGKYTTANLLFSIKYPEAANKEFQIFSGIEDGILSGLYDAGVIIHENRFTFEQKGLKKICDLGEYWEETYKALIPLGCIAIKRELGWETQKQITKVIRKSIEFAFNNPESSIDFVRQHAQEMDDAVIRKHINLYVNRYSLDLGSDGCESVIELYKIAQEKNLIPELHQPIFVE